MGIGTNYSDVLSNMGPNGIPGASLRGWRAFFPNSNVYGGDIDTRILFQEDRIKTYFCDQLNSQIIQNMWNQIEVDFFDIIVDDGLHTFEANKCFLLASLHKLHANGIFIIEDVITPAISKYKDFLDTIPNINYHLFQLKYNPRLDDNNFIAIWK